MSQKTYASLFSCAGCVDQLPMTNGYRHVFAVEYDPEMANLFHHNYPDVPLFVQDVVTFKPPSASPLDWLHASPPCTLDSGARLKSVTDDELLQQKRQSLSVVRIAAKTRARFVSIENVSSYYQSRAFADMDREMNMIGYRGQMISVKGGEAKIGQDRSRTFCLFFKSSNHIPDVVCESAEYSNWSKAFNLDKMGAVDYEHIKPVKRLVTSLRGTPDIAYPVIIERIGYKGDKPQFRTSSGNMWTIKSAIADDYKQGNGRSKYLLVVDENGVGYNVHHDQLKLLQGFRPDFYLSENCRIAVRAIGNACPPQMLAKAIREIKNVVPVLEYCNLPIGI